MLEEILESRQPHEDQGQAAHRGTRLEGSCRVMQGKCWPLRRTGFAPRRRLSERVSTFSYARSLLAMEPSTSKRVMAAPGNLAASLQSRGSWMINQPGRGAQKYQMAAMQCLTY